MPSIPDLSGVAAGRRWKIPDGQDTRTLPTFGIIVHKGTVGGDWMRYFSELKGYRDAFGSLRFWTLLIGTVLFILLFAGADMWLSNEIGWPDSYGFQCRGRGCWIEYLAHSPSLLRGGSVYELALFALLWSMPAIVAGCVIFALLKRRRHNTILPME